MVGLCGALLRYTNAVPAKSAFVRNRRRIHGVWDAVAAAPAGSSWSVRRWRFPIRSGPHVAATHLHRCRYRSAQSIRIDYFLNVRTLEGGWKGSRSAAAANHSGSSRFRHFAPHDTSSVTSALGVRSVGALTPHQQVSRLDFSGCVLLMSWC